MGAIAQITPKDDLVALVKKAPKDATIILSAGTYNLHSAIVVDKTLTLRGATGDPSDVIVSRNGSTALLVIDGKPTFEAITFVSPKEDGSETYFDDIVAYESCAAIRGKGDATFLRCRSTSAEQSAFSVRGEKARIHMKECDVRNTAHGGVFFDGKGRGVIENCIFENTGLGCVDVSEKGFAHVRGSKLLGSGIACVMLHEDGEAKIENCEICAKQQFGARVQEGSRLDLSNSRVYAYASNASKGTKYSGNGVLVDESSCEIKNCLLNVLGIAVFVVPGSKCVVRDVEISSVSKAIALLPGADVKVKGKNKIDVENPIEYLDLQDGKEGDDAPPKKDFSEEERERADKIKDAYYLKLLGQPWENVLHSQIPFDVGGPLDGYIYPNSQFGGYFFVTKELVNPDFELPTNRSFKSYELGIATRDPFVFPDPSKHDPAVVKRFTRRHKMLTNLARYAEDSSNVNVYDTLEFPKDFEDKDVAGACFIFSALEPVLDDEESDGSAGDLESMLAQMRQDIAASGKGKPDDQTDKRPQFGLLIAIEIFESEMRFAMQNKGAILVKELKEAGAWPFSDLTRRPLH